MTTPTRWEPLRGLRATERLEVHHLLPRSKGGADELANLRTFCESCHQAAHEGC